MVKLKAIIERASDGNYAVYCKDQIFTGAGSSIEEAKKDMVVQMAFYKDTALKKGFKYPAFLDEMFEIEYTIAGISPRH